MTTISSTIGRHPVDIDPLATLVTQLKEVQIEKNSIVTKINGYINVLETNLVQHPMPEIEYEPRSRTCCRIQFKGMCINWNIFRTVACCGVKNYYYIRERVAGSVVLNTKRAREIPSDDQNELTNAAFFLDLYNTYTEYLAPAWEEAICYMKTHSLQKEAVYWTSWDPTSGALLSPQKAKFFRGVIDDVCKVMHECRKEAMKQQIEEAQQRQKEEAKTPVTLLEPHNGYMEVVSNVSNELYFTPMTDGFTEDSEDFIRPIKTHTPPNVSPHTGEGSSSGSDSSDNSIQERGSDRELGKVVKVKGVFVKFNCEKIKNDLLEMTECSIENATEIALGVEEQLKFPCTPEVIWKCVGYYLLQKQIKVKAIEPCANLQEVKEAMKHDFKLQRVPEGLFVDLVAEKRRKKDKSPFQRSIPREIVRVGNSPLNGSNQFIAQKEM